MPASFYEHEVKADLKNKRMLSKFLDGLIHERRKDVKKVQLRYIFCNDGYLLQMNMQYLQHDTLTDIITFDLSDKAGCLTGEIYISIERVRENATKFSAVYTDEMLRVLFHGALHLCGYKDKNNNDKAVMRSMEDECIAAYKKQIAG